MSKIVYVGMTADSFHHGHINIIEHAREYGDVVVGLLTDKAVTRFKRLPFLDYEQRKKIVSNIKGVVDVIPQEEWDYTPNLKKLKPDYMVHGDNWREGRQAKYRDRALAAMAEWGGQIIEVPYTRDIAERKHARDNRLSGITPDIRLESLRRTLNAIGFVRVLEVHSPLCGLIVENLKIEKEDQSVRFDAMWSSSLTDSTVKGKPDTESVDMTKRLSGINELFEVTTRPLIIDADTGGKIEHFGFMVRSMERMGISATIIEDKTGLKKNSLLGNDVEQTQENVDLFCEKITTGKQAQITDDFMIIGRIESLILEAGMEDALYRAKRYVEAGADGIMIHSRQKQPDEIFEFCQRFRENDPDTPLAVVPTSYSQTYEKDLIANGVNVVIYANHMLRASYPGMLRVAETILDNGRAKEADELCMSIKDILSLIPGTV